MKLHHQKEIKASNGHHPHEFILKKVESVNWWIIPDGELAPEIKIFSANVSMICANDSPAGANGTYPAINSTESSSVHHRRKHPKKWFLPKNKLNH